MFDPCSQPTLELWLVPDITLHCLELSGDFCYFDREFGYFFFPCLCTYLVEITDVEEKENMKVNSCKTDKSL